MARSADIDVGEVLEGAPLGRFHLLTVGLCFFVVVRWQRQATPPLWLFAEALTLIEPLAAAP